MRLTAATLLAITLLSLTLSTAARADDYVIMKVNGQDISSAEARRFWEGLFPEGQAPAFDSVSPDIRDKVLRGVMAEKLLYGEAVKAGVDKSEALERQLADIKRKLVVRNFLDQKTTTGITEADLKAEYDAQVASAKDEREVRARHILLNSEADAKEAKKKIDGGKSFEEVAHEYSKDPGSAKQGGDLGYFTRDKMVKEFADAAFALKKGEISGPVKSTFGWHIIKLEDSRKVAPPPFAQVRDELKGKLQERRLNDYVAGLVKAADIKVYDAKGKAVSFDKNLPPSPTASEKPAADAKPDAKADGKADSKSDSSGEKPAAAKETKESAAKSESKSEKHPAKAAH